MDSFPGLVNEKRLEEDDGVLRLQVRFQAWLGPLCLLD